MKTIRVVAAVIKAVNESGEPVIFATQRGYGEFQGGWEFPGGKLEVGESPEQALVREIKEELNSEIEIVSYINEASYDYNFGTVVMKTYHAKLISGNLELLEHQNSTWLAPHELDTLNWANSFI